MLTSKEPFFKILSILPENISPILIAYSRKGVLSAYRFMRFLLVSSKNSNKKSISLYFPLVMINILLLVFSSMNLLFFFIESLFILLSSIFFSIRSNDIIHRLDSSIAISSQVNPFSTISTII